MGTRTVMRSREQSTSAGPASFQTTHWSLVLMANQIDSPEAPEARNRLCQLYWYPVYAFIRRRGFDHHTAKDLTQGLFGGLFEKDGFQAADRERGRFRTFLLACVQHFLAHQHKREHALKRGGQFDFVSLDEVLAENRYVAEPASPVSPEKLFERQWALALLDQTLSRLKEEYTSAGRSAQFEVLQTFLGGTREAAISYAEAGAQCGGSEASMRQIVHRMRQRYGELLREQVAETVTSPAELESEMKHLRSVLSE